ncbi:uncharacterized protein [Palaemon carinicauda]|uniref:uncharacterized protein n=1 Tax=Palaemon carinicauda TaxID=392227 RepID=UPI0035B61A11
MELTAAAVAAQLDCKIRSELYLELCDTVFWTDSTSVLKYISNQCARYHTFLNNQVNLIRDLSDIPAWRYVNTSANPADLASRGLDVDSSLELSLLLTGPEFLCQEQGSWLALPNDVKRAELDGDSEIKQSAPIFSMVVPEPILVEKIAAKFSSWTKIVRIIARLRRLGTKSGSEVLTVNEMNSATTIIWKKIQVQEYGMKRCGSHFYLPDSVSDSPGGSQLDGPRLLCECSEKITARRGDVKRIWSDNGTNLVAADLQVKEALQDFKEVEIAQTLAAKGIEWCFNPPHASHFGEVWERLIRSVRRALSATCLQQVSTDDTLSTLFCEAESLVNGRPLTKVNDDPDCPLPLKPSMLLTLKSAVLPVTKTDQKELYVRRRWCQAQYLADQFWKRWLRQYLPLLQERQKWTVQRRETQVGDIMLNTDERLPRGSWPLGRVLEVTRDSDNRVRQAKIKTECGLYLLPVQKMCLLLEIECDDSGVPLEKRVNIVRCSYGVLSSNLASLMKYMNTKEEEYLTSPLCGEWDTNEWSAPPKDPSAVTLVRPTVIYLEIAQQKNNVGCSTLTPTPALYLRLRNQRKGETREIDPPPPRRMTAEAAAEVKVTSGLLKPQLKDTNGLTLAKGRSMYGLGEGFSIDHALRARCKVQRWGERE